MITIITDAHLKEFIELDETIKRLTKRLEVLKSTFKEQGTFTTEHYACVVLIQRQERIASLSDVCAVFTRELVEANGLINKIQFPVVKVAKIA